MDYSLDLSPRLLTVAKAVPPCEIMADIGTDHAYIPVFLVKNGTVKRAIASDIAKGPAKRAENNIKAHGLSDKITVVVGNGLSKIEKADVFVIAGMGGNMVCDILKDSGEKAKSADCIVLQPMTCLYDVRKFLCENGYKIIFEDLAQEDDKIYNILKVKAGEQTVNDDVFHHLGGYLIENNHPLLGEYIKKRIHSLTVAADNMKNSTSEEVQKKRAENLKLICEFKKVGETLD